MKEKPRKKKRPTLGYVSQRETRVLLEDINKNVKIVTEQNGSIVRKLEEHDKRFDNIEFELSAVKAEVGAIKVEMGAVKAELCAVKSELGSVEMAVTENSRDIKTLKAEVKALKQGQEKLEQGQEKLEQGQEEIKQKLDTTLTDHEQRIKKVEEKIGA